MDYRKPVTFGENWSPSRYKVLPYFAAEKAVLIRPSSQRILDLGCASGWNMSRFRQYGRFPFGIDVVPDRVQLAAHHGPVAIASGLELPFANELNHSKMVVFVRPLPQREGQTPQRPLQQHDGE